MDSGLEELCWEVQQIARAVGEFIKNEVHRVKANDIETKSLNSLVSYVDQQAEQKIVDRLMALLPEAGFIAEEGTASNEGQLLNWIIDPLDGTTNFLHSIPVFAVSIALKKEKEIILGVVYEINQDECFHAIKGGGAFLNAQEISVSSAEQLSDGLIATGFPYYDFKRMDGYFNTLRYFAENTRGIRRMGSAAVDLAYVACGRFDAFYEYSLHAWDVAAGALIVQEAGGTVSDFKGGNEWLFGKEIMATNPKVYSSVLSLLQKNFS